MKKITAFLFLSFTACKKQATPQTCYECEMTYASGLPAAKQYPCTTDIHQWKKEQKDNNGDPISAVCKEL